MMGTNTSQEIEALHRALKEVGLSGTLGNDSQLDISSQGDKGTTADLVQKLLNTSAKTGWYCLYYLGLMAIKPVSAVSDKRDSNQCPQLQILGRKLKFHMRQVMI